MCLLLPQSKKEKKELEQTSSASATMAHRALETVEGRPRRAARATFCKEENARLPTTRAGADGEFTSFFFCVCVRCTVYGGCCADAIELCINPGASSSPPPPPPPQSTGGGPGNTPLSPIPIKNLPFSFSGDSTGFSNTISLGGGPDVFFTFTTTPTVRRAGG